MKRRSLLKTGIGLTGGTFLSGCLGSLGFETQSAWRDPPLVNDRPDAVYYPAIVEGMGMYGTTTAGDVGFALMHSFPHRFWNLTGTNRTKVVVNDSDSIHLMASIWDVETGVILPLDVTVELTGDNGEVTTTNLWPMISPNMGFHYGDNIELAGEGQYEATLRVGPLQANRTTEFKNRFIESHSATISFVFDTNETYNLEYRRLGDKAGTRGTVDLMEMDMVPAPVAPPKAELPGRLLGMKSAANTEIPVTIVPSGRRFTQNDLPYLLASPRTPYNHVLLPNMGISATVTREGETVTKGPLLAALDSEIGYHYGMPTESLRAGDTVTLTVDIPPQLARHDGYETAFLDIPPVKYTV